MIQILLMGRLPLKYSYACSNIPFDRWIPHSPKLCCHALPPSTCISPTLAGFQVFQQRGQERKKANVSSEKAKDSFTVKRKSSATFAPACLRKFASQICCFEGFPRDFLIVEKSTPSGSQNVGSAVVYAKINVHQGMSIHFASELMISFAIK